MADNCSFESTNYNNFWEISSNNSVYYNLIYCSNIFELNNNNFKNIFQNDRALIIIDEVVYKFYGENLKKYLKFYNLNYKILKLKCSESEKNWETTNLVLNFFENEGVIRRETIVAIGGGVLLDIVGFACSFYRRGIPYIRIPTTLLGIVDASVGSKVAINYANKRNRIGSYYPPEKVLIDKKFIETQTDREINNGLAEILKICIIKDKELFLILEKNYELLKKEKFQFGAIPVKVINSSIKDMIEELEPNLWEKNLLRCVDFGHIFSPLIEMKNVDSLLHGEAVILDCLFTSCLSYQRNYIDLNTLQRIKNLIESIGLPTFHKDFTNEELLFESLNDSIKHRNGSQNIPAPTNIGEFKFINDLTIDELKNTIEIFEIL